MSGNAYKALGFVVWWSGAWRLRRRCRRARRVGARMLAAGAVAAAVAAVAAQRRNGGAR